MTLGLCSNCVGSRYQHADEIVQGLNRTTPCQSMETLLGFELIGLSKCRHRERDRAVEPKFMISKGPF